MEALHVILFIIIGSISFAHGKDCMYKITLFTGDRQGAGSDADVYMRLVSQSGASLNFQLNRPANSLLPNSARRFVQRNACVGRICKIEVTQNGKNPNSSWYCKGLTVQVRRNRKCVSSENFTIDQWIKDPELQRSGNGWRTKYHWYPANNCGQQARSNPIC